MTSTMRLGTTLLISGRKGMFGTALLVLVLASVAVNVARAEDYVFDTQTARLTIRSDGIASSLIDKQNGKERLRSAGLAFAVVKKGGRLFPASNVTGHGGLFHVTFGTAGVDADY